MTKSELARVEAAARRFLDMCEHARREDHTSKVVNEEYAAKAKYPTACEPIDSDYFENPSKHVAAVKRASLDLTRELANLRRRGT